MGRYYVEGRKRSRNSFCPGGRPGGNLLLDLISIIKSTRYHDSHLGKATQANAAYLRLSRSSLSRLSILLGSQCPSRCHRYLVLRCLTSRRIFLLPVRTQLSFDGRHASWCFWPIVDYLRARILFPHSISDTRSCIYPG